MINIFLTNYGIAYPLLADLIAVPGLALSFEPEAPLPGFKPGPDKLWEGIPKGPVWS
jgi:hypothetical protein